MVVCLLLGSGLHLAVVVLFLASTCIHRVISGDGRSHYTAHRQVTPPDILRTIMIHQILR